MMRLTPTAMSVVTMTPEYSGPPACCSLEMIVSSEPEEQAAVSSSSKGTKNRRALGLTIFRMSPCPLARLSIWKILVVQMGMAVRGRAGVVSLTRLAFFDA